MPFGNQIRLRPFFEILRFIATFPAITWQPAFLLTQLGRRLERFALQQREKKEKKRKLNHLKWTFFPTLYPPRYLFNQRSDLPPFH